MGGEDGDLGGVGGGETLFRIYCMKSPILIKEKTSRTLHSIQFTIIHATVGNSMGTSAKSASIWFSEASIMLLAVGRMYTNDSLRMWWSRD